MKLPYGNADFYRLVKDGEVYVDRTDRIGDLEQMGKALLFLRPRRFGKSLFLRTLSCYYDLRYQAEHDELFGSLAVGDRPTELAHRYFVLEWDFSLVVPELSPGGLGTLLNGYVNSEIESFLSDYRDHLPGTLEVGEVAVENLTALLALIRQTPYRLYLLVDEYDNFANEVMMSDPRAYKGLVGAEGPLRGLMKWVKAAMKGRGMDRLLVTGVSPIVMSDVTSSLNITKNVSQHPGLADLCGFREDEVRRLLNQLLSELADAGVSLPGVAELSSPEAEDDVLDMMRDWYDGYRFAETARERIYNPTLVLYFLDRLQDYHAYPRRMLDSNLSMDTGKLEYLAREASGQQAVMDVLQTGKPLVVDAIADGFSLSEMMHPEGHDPTSLGSFLYFFGMLTQEGRNNNQELLLTPPNLVTQALYVDHVRKLLLAEGSGTS
ncbi:MAG: AAA family ATPase [bacterium]|nr:AAA family ATPase [bacterium]